MGTPTDPERYIDWLVEETREVMVERASWIKEHRPNFATGVLHHGSQEASILYEDAQLCYIHCLYTGAIVLAQSYIERSVCGFAYSAGRFSEGDRPSYHDAVDFLTKEDIIDPDEVEGVPLDELHELRNPLVHFRPATDESTLGGRAREAIRESGGWEPPKIPQEMLKEDSERALKTMFSVVRLFGIGREVG